MKKFKLDNTQNGFRIPRFFGAKRFLKEIDKDYFMKFRCFICNRKTHDRVIKTIEKAHRKNECWTVTINNNVPDGVVYVNGVF